MSSQFAFAENTAKTDKSDSGHFKSRRHSSNLSSIKKPESIQDIAGNLAMQRLFRSGDIQAKIPIGQPGDAYEREADEVAGQVLQMNNGACRCGGTCPKCQTEQGLSVRRQPDQVGGRVNSGVSNQLLNHLGEGSRLDTATRAYFEPRFGTDLGHVRIHTNERAANTAQSINAQAFTLGDHVVFGPGQYAPGTGQGRQVLAHELTHTIQQSGGSEATPGRSRIAGTGSPKVQGIFGEAAQWVAGQVAGWFSEPRNRQFAADLLASVRESYTHAPEILGDVWDNIRQHWLAFTTVLFGLLAAETVIGILAGVPEPTLLTKVVSVVLQALVILVLGYFAAVELVGVYDEARNWWRLARQANGDPATITEASRAFCRMVFHVVMAILILIGVRARVRGFGVPTAAAEPPPSTSTGTRPNLRLIRGEGGGVAARQAPVQTTQPAVSGTSALAVEEVPATTEPALPPPLYEVPQPIVEPVTEPVSAVSSATGAGPSVSSTVGSTAAATSAAQQAEEEEERPPECQPEPVCPHLGGDPIHNACADTIPPNRFPGCDVLVRTKRFDALSVGQDKLWEFKTNRYSTYPQFLKTITIQNDMADIAVEKPIADSCGFNYEFAVADEEEYDDLIAAGANLLAPIGLYTACLP